MKYYCEVTGNEITAKETYVDMTGGMSFTGDVLSDTLHLRVYCKCHGEEARLVTEKQWAVPVDDTEDVLFGVPL